MCDQTLLCSFEMCNTLRISCVLCRCPRRPGSDDSSMHLMPMHAADALVQSLETAIVGVVLALREGLDWVRDTM
jgi:hypothetical protein